MSNVNIDKLLKALEGLNPNYRKDEGLVEIEIDDDESLFVNVDDDGILSEKPYFMTYTMWVPASRANPGDSTDYDLGPLADEEQVAQLVRLVIGLSGGMNRGGEVTRLAVKFVEVAKQARPDPEEEARIEATVEAIMKEEAEMEASRRG